jgi:hypothetical protein
MAHIRLIDSRIDRNILTQQAIIGEFDADFRRNGQITVGEFNQLLDIVKLQKFQINERKKI